VNKDTNYQAGSDCGSSLGSARLSEVFDSNSFLHAGTDEENLELINSAIGRFSGSFINNLIWKQRIIEENIGIPITKFQVMCISQWAFGHPFANFDDEKLWLETYLKFVTKFGSPSYEE